MGLLRGAAKAGIAAKAFQIIRREASKPQNQQKAKELFNQVANRNKSGKRR